MVTIKDIEKQFPGCFYEMGRMKFRKGKTLWCITHENNNKGGKPYILGYGATKTEAVKNTLENIKNFL